MIDTVYLVFFKRATKLIVKLTSRWSCPNGFSIIRRFHPSVLSSPLSLIFKAMVSKNSEQRKDKTFYFLLYVILLPFHERLVITSHSLLAYSHLMDNSENYLKTFQFWSTFFPDGKTSLLILLFFLKIFMRYLTSSKPDNRYLLWKLLISI